MAVFASGKPVVDHVALLALATPSGWLEHLCEGTAILYVSSNKHGTSQGQQGEVAVTRTVEDRANVSWEEKHKVRIKVTT